MVKVIKQQIDKTPQESEILWKVSFVQNAKENYGISTPGTIVRKWIWMIYF